MSRSAGSEPLEIVARALDRASAAGADAADAILIVSDSLAARVRGEEIDFVKQASERILGIRAYVRGAQGTRSAVISTSDLSGPAIERMASEAVALGAPKGQLRKRQPGGPLRRPDIVDVVRIVAHAGQSRALRVSSDQGDGVLGFVNGSPIHAAAGHLRGNDAFLQMVLWEESRFAAFEASELLGGDANITAPLEELLQEAVGLRVAIEGDHETLDLAADESSSTDVLRWWARATARDKAIVRVLIGFDTDATCGCVQTFSEVLADELKPIKHWVSEPEDGPSFVRVHVEDGGVLSLTFLPMEARNRFYFETFCQTSDAVVICRADETDEIMGWRECIPSSVSSVVCNDCGAGGDGMCPAVRRLVEQEV